MILQTLQASDLVCHVGVTALQILPHAIQWLTMSYLSLQPDARIKFPPQKTIVESSLFVGIPFPKWRAFLTIWSMEENSFRLQHELIDSNLNWKKRTHEIGEKISRGIGILSKLTHFVTIDNINQLYYSLVYPFLTYGLIAWGNTYTTTLKPVVVLQQKAVRIINFLIEMLTLALCFHS